MKIVSFLLLRREHRVEVRNHGDAFAGTTTFRQHKVLAELSVRALHVLSAKTQRRKTVGRELSQAIDAVAIRRETIDPHHLPQHLKRFRQPALEELIQGLDVQHGEQSVANALVGQPWSPLSHNRACFGVPAK
jgi:hypothetical protein